MSEGKLRRYNTLVIWIVSVPAALWLGAELMRAMLEVERTRGYTELLFDGVVQHKVGELLIMFPILCVLLALNRRSEEQMMRAIDGVRWMILAGGVLNGIAWLSLADRAVPTSFLRVWCSVLLVFSIFAPRVLKLIVAQEKAASRTQHVI